MAVVTIRIHGRDYQIACDDGQETDLRRLGDEVDERVSALVAGMGASPGEYMALLLTALTMADELNEKQKEMDILALEMRKIRSLNGMASRARAQSGDTRLADMEAAMAATLDDVAARLEKIADKIEIA